MHWLPLLLAEGEQGGPAELLRGPMVPMFLVVMFMLVMMMRNSSRQKKQMQETLAKLKKNDKVITTAGIIGVVVAIKENEDEVTLRVDDTTNSRIRVLRSTISRVVAEEQTGQTTETKTT